MSSSMTSDDKVRMILTLRVVEISTRFKPAHKIEVNSAESLKTILAEFAKLTAETPNVGEDDLSKSCGKYIFPPASILSPFLFFFFQWECMLKPCACANIAFTHIRFIVLWATTTSTRL